MIYRIIASMIVLSVSTQVWAKQTAEEILAAGGSPAEIGRMIAQEADKRDLGFDDFQVEVEMILRNAHGDTSTRYMRNKTLEVKDETLGDKTMIVFDRPRDVKGTAFLTFSKILDPDDQWLYLPSLKRVKRISSKNKSGPFVGSEFAYEDISSQEVEKYSYRYLRNEPCPKEVSLECFVVERKPLYEHSGYTRMVTWLDIEEFRPMSIVFYDRKNDMLKTLSYTGYQQYLDKFWRADAFYMVNHQTGKSTDLFWKNYRFRTGLGTKDFNKATLKRAK